MNKIVSGLLVVVLTPILFANLVCSTGKISVTINPTYPTFTKNVNKSMSTLAGTNKWNKTDEGKAEEEFSINIYDYASSASEFFTRYPNVDFNYTGYVEDSFGKQIHFPNESSTSHFPFSAESAQGLFYKVYSSGAENKCQSSEEWKASLNDGILKISFYSYSVVWQGLNSSWTQTNNWFTIDSVTFDSSFDLNAIHSGLSQQFGQTINYVSDFSGSIFEEHNKKAISDMIDMKFKTVLGADYDAWKQYIYQYSFSDEPANAILTVRLADRDINWTFNQKISIALSPQYWGQSLSKRLHIQPGKIVNPDDSTKGMIDDTGIQLEPQAVTANYGGTVKYHTSANIEFDADPQNDEWLEINGEKIQVLNNKFYYNLADLRINNPNDPKPSVYDVAVFHESATDKAKYEIKYEISTLVPTFQAKWYGWNPDTNPDQAALISPTLPDGRPNPAYDKDVNPKTGTKTQILWINHKTDFPFALDPLNKDGKVISDPSDYDLGFIAEGSVVGKGVQQLFDPKQLASVSREGVNPDLSPIASPGQDEKLTEIQPDKDNQYWSWEGFWHYITKTDDRLAFEKYVLIGAKYQGAYASFLDVLNEKNPEKNIAVDFWTTLHGQHLKNYLVDYKQLDSAAIQNLNFEQVSAFWKDYTSDVISQRVPPPQPISSVDITGEFAEVKMNEDSLDKIVILVDEAVGSDINSKINKPGVTAHIGIDYNIFSADGKDINKDSSGLSDLLNDKDSFKIAKLKVISTPASTLISGTANISVLNSQKYDPTTAADLSKIKGRTYEYNYTSFSAAELRSWILEDAKNELDYAGYSKLVLNTDYGVSDNGIPPADEKTNNNVPGELSDDVLNKFIIITQGDNTLTVTVYAANLSLNAVGSFTFTLINNKNAPPAPPSPPSPPVPPKPEPGFWTQGKNLAWVVVVIIAGTALLAVGIYYLVIRFRNKKIK